MSACRAEKERGTERERYCAGKEHVPRSRLYFFTLSTVGAAFFNFGARESSRRSTIDGRGGFRFRKRGWEQERLRTQARPSGPGRPLSLLECTYSIPLTQGSCKPPVSAAYSSESSCTGRGRRPLPGFSRQRSSPF